MSAYWRSLRELAGSVGDPSLASSSDGAHEDLGFGSSEARGAMATLMGAHRLPGGVTVTPQWHDWLSMTQARFHTIRV